MGVLYVRLWPLAQSSKCYLAVMHGLDHVSALSERKMNVHKSHVASKVLSCGICARREHLLYIHLRPFCIWNLNEGNVVVCMECDVSFSLFCMRIFCDSIPKFSYCCVFRTVHFLRHFWSFWRSLLASEKLFFATLEQTSAPQSVCSNGHLEKQIKLPFKATKHRKEGMREKLLGLTACSGTASDTDSCVL